MSINHINIVDNNVFISKYLFDISHLDIEIYDKYNNKIYKRLNRIILYLQCRVKSMIV